MIFIFLMNSVSLFLKSVITTSHVFPNTYYNDFTFHIQKQWRRSLKYARSEIVHNKLCCWDYLSLFFSLSLCLSFHNMIGSYRFIATFVTFWCRMMIGGTIDAYFLLSYWYLFKGHSPAEILLILNDAAWQFDLRLLLDSPTFDCLVWSGLFSHSLYLK
jgi:hypothetical protein